MDWIAIGLNALSLLAGAVVMEAVAWATHKWIMHGLLWSLHEDHHRPHKGPFEKNDLFALFFAGISIAFILGGALNNLWPLLWFGIGTTVYGLLYTIFHDIIFHKRVKIKVPRWPYLRRIINAHRVHHSGRDDQRRATSFGFLWASKRYDTYPPADPPQA